ncbi:hypothetical protein Taro_050546, partial [Colocasia esculenta]|nr:hypothetical protein [Colocasia esculenta]
GLEESKNNPSDKKVVISSGGSRFTKGEEVFVNKQLHRDAFQILSALRRPPQQSLVPGKPLVDAACPQYLGLSHSDLPGIGCALKSDTVPETPSDVPKLVNPDCEVELWMVNHSPSSSILYGEGPCKSPITNLGVDSTVKNFLHLGTSGIVSEASDAANGSGGRTCIKEPHGSHAEEKSMQDYMGLNSNALQNKEHGNNETCSQLHSDNMNPENAGFKGFHSLSASGLACAEAFPNINVDEKASELKTSPEEATIVDEYPSFDLGFELYYYKTSFGPSDHNR